MKTEIDRSFDDIAKKFHSNIYGTTKGKLRQEVLMHHLTTTIPTLSDAGNRQLSILDAGGGTGVMTQAMSELGHRVMLNDISGNSLDIARKALVNYSNIDYFAGPIQSISVKEKYDLVICHAVLEWLASPFEVLAKLEGLVKNGGYLSLSFFNRDAQRFGNILYGNFDYVENKLTLPRVVKLSPRNPLSPEEVIYKVEELPFNIIHKAGIRCFHDYLKEKGMQQSHFQQLKRLEIELGTSHPYLWFGKYFHLIAKKET
ncbi:methyltransferase domain-containing protein [Aliikangiella sp. G2MR2-5]|uniref:methyltransferase domain-containing protein n=1 Tax=Aliikangiella sp. G2MR2-5 TaxID=2788943 RepID=UPI0018A98DA1|nr:methyltransferase domain-containing protein [Aliikangiella sp. G2MR2-5]